MASDATIPGARWPLLGVADGEGRAGEVSWGGRFRALSMGCSALVALGGCAVLVGWALGIPLLKSALPGLVSMKPNTALGFLLCGAALWAANARGGRAAPLGLRVLASAACAIGLITLAEYASGAGFGIDETLFRDDAHATGTSHPGRMAPSTAICLTLSGMALFFSRRQGPSLAAHLLPLAVLALSTLACLGYLYRVPPLYRIGPYTSMAVHTGVMFVVLALGTLLAQRGGPLLSVLAGDTAGSTMLRNMIPVVLGVPPAMGYLRMQMELRGHVPPAFGVALVMVLTMGVFSAVVWSGARSLHRSDAETRRQADVHRAILTCLGEGVVVADAAGKFVVWNPAAERLVGLGPRDVPQSEWSREYGVFLPDGRTPYPAERLPLARAIRGEAVDGDEQFLRRPGMPEGVWLRVSGRPLVDGSGARLGGVVAFSDITGPRKAQAELESLAGDLRRRTEELEAANRELESFSYSVSHDLRGPLRSIDGFSRALQEDAADRLDESGKGHLARVRAAVGRMGHLIDDLLALSHVIRAPLNREPVDLAALAVEIAAELQGRDAARAATFALVREAPAVGDGRLLRIVLENLLGNAWKFTSRNASARIEFGTFRTEEGKTVYFVRDDGAGFDPAHAKKMFGAFQRMHAASDFPGTGIGLATVQRIVHRHGGRIWAEGAEGRGATFYFTL